METASGRHSNPHGEIQLYRHSGRRNPGGLRAARRLAEWTGLEPATPGLTGRYSNQLNYHSGAERRPWWVLRGSNPRPSPCKGDALPTELSTQGAD